jgi:hypothetical protein
MRKRSRTQSRCILEPLSFQGCISYEQWIVTGEFDPRSHSRRRVDLVIRFTDEQNNIRVLCFFEGKKQTTSSPEEIRECESQTLNACRKHLNAYDQEFVYMVTGCGTKVKPWDLRKAGRIIAYGSRNGSR